MKLLCINAGKIEASDGYPTLGAGLVEGQVYTYNGEIYDGRSDADAKCYFIIELQQLKRCERFFVLADDETESNEVETSETKIEK